MRPFRPSDWQWLSRVCSTKVFHIAYCLIFKWSSSWIETGTLCMPSRCCATATQPLSMMNFICLVDVNFPNTDRSSCSLSQYTMVFTILTVIRNHGYRVVCSCLDSGSVGLVLPHWLRFYLASMAWHWIHWASNTDPFASVCLSQIATFACHTFGLLWFDLCSVGLAGPVFIGRLLTCGCLVFLCLAILFPRMQWISPHRKWRMAGGIIFRSSWNWTLGSNSLDILGFFSG